MCDRGTYALSGFSNNHYFLRNNVYKAMLERFYDVIVDEMWLAVCNPDNPRYIATNVQDMSAEATQLFSDREQELASCL